MYIDGERPPDAAIRRGEGLVGVGQVDPAPETEWPAGGKCPLGKEAKKDTSYEVFVSSTTFGSYLPLVLRSAVEVVACHRTHYNETHVQQAGVSLAIWGNHMLW